MSNQSLNEKGKMPKKFSVKSGDKSKAGGLTAKGVKRYRAANPGSKLKTAVTTKPSKLKKGSKSAKRRKSFCARMGGMKKRLTSAKTRRDPDSRINKALRKWNCSTDVNPNMKASIAERFLAEARFERGMTPEEKRAARDARRGMDTQQRRIVHKATRGTKTTGPQADIRNRNKEVMDAAAARTKRAFEAGKERVRKAISRGTYGKDIRREGRR